MDATKGQIMNHEKLIDEAKWVIILFDQANTNQTIEKLGSRGELLKNAVDDLRKVFTDAGIDPYSTNSFDWEEA